MDDEMTDPYRMMERMERSMLGNFGIFDHRFDRSPLEDLLKQVERLDDF
jgi:hypothetical protein